VTMFDLAIGTSGYPPMILGMAGLTPDMIGRYRDHWLERSEAGVLIMALYTRNGGGNREEYAEHLRQMHDLDSFVSDADDEFDSTYCTLRFRVTKEQALDWLNRHRTSGADFDDEEVWDEMVNAAEEIPRDMSLIWRATINAMEGGTSGE